MTKNINEKMRWWQDRQTISLLKNSLHADHCSITSTDTVLGLLAPFTQNGLEKLNTIKGSQQNKPNLVLIGSPKKLEAFVDTAILNEKICKLIEICWPGPVTLIFKALPNWPRQLVSAQGTIALRCPKHTGLLTLLESFDGLFSTSANLSGQKPPESIDEIDPSILSHIDYIVVDQEQRAEKSLPSTILDISDGKSIKVVREGAYPVPRLEDF